VGAGLGAPLGKLCMDGAFTRGRMRKSTAWLAASTAVWARAGNFDVSVGEAGRVGRRRVDFSFSNLQRLPDSDGRSLGGRVEVAGFGDPGQVQLTESLA
jgi:hypothetical protein